MSKRKRKSKHIDKSVLYLFGLLSLVALITLGYKKANYYSCDEVSYAISNSDKDAPYRVGGLVKFVDFTDDAVTWEWNFGDDTEVDNNRQALHQYTKAGKYMVSLRVNNLCLLEERIVVLDSMVVHEEIVDVPTVITPTFTFPRYLYEGKTAVCRDMTPGVTSRQWTFDGNLLATTDSVVRYRFETVGEKWVKLVINGDERTAILNKITVIEDNRVYDTIPWTGIDTAVTKVDAVKTITEPKPEPAVINRYKSKSELIRQIYTLSKGQQTLAAFSVNLCDGKDTKITVNGERMTFEQFYNMISGKSIDIKELNPVREMKTKCVQTMTIDFRNKIF